MNRLTTAAVGVVAVLAVAAGAAVALLSQNLTAANVAATALVAALFAAATRKYRQHVLSPVLIVSAGIAVVGLAGRWLYDAVAGARGGGGARILLSAAVEDRALLLVLTADAAFLAGALLVGSRSTHGDVHLRGVQLSRANVRRIQALAPLPLAVFVYAYGVGELTERPRYIANFVGPTPAVSVSMILGLAAVSGLGFLVGAGISRWYALTLTLMYAAAFFALGSRRMALVPLIFALGAFAARPTRRGRMWLAAVGALSLYLLGLAIQFRGLSSHGLLPYGRALPDIVAGGASWSAVGRNLLISFAIIAVTAFRMPQFPPADLVVSLNPLPGQMAGWYDIAPSHRVNVYTPAAGLGELGNAGWLTTLAVCLALGVVVGWLDIRSRRHIQDGRTAMGLVITLLCALFLLFLVQYNLRAAVRPLYYALALELAFGLWGVRRARGRTGSAASPERCSSSQSPQPLRTTRTRT